MLSCRRQGDPLMNTLTYTPKFALGDCYITPGIQAIIEQHQYPINQLIARHHAGDWGDLCQDDKKENDFALKNNLRIFSSYLITLNNETMIKVWIITEADRSSTTVLLPSEY